MNPFVATAREAWGETPPDWVIRLAEECAATSQNRAAKRLGRSASLVSAVLRGKYSGDMAAVEDIVRGALMAETLECPALGRLPLNECRAWRAKSRNFVNVNSLRVRMYRACNRCPVNKEPKS